MSRVTTDNCCVFVAVQDHDGTETGREALVICEYAIEVDDDYGADADGRRGMRRVEYDLLDCWLPAAELKRLTAAEIKQVLADAPDAFWRRQHHH